MISSPLSSRRIFESYNARTDVMNIVNDKQCHPVNATAILCLRSIWNRTFLCLLEIHNIRKALFVYSLKALCFRYFISQIIQNTFIVKHIQGTNGLAGDTRSKSVFQTKLRSRLFGIIPMIYNYTRRSIKVI